MGYNERPYLEKRGDEGEDKRGEKKEKDYLN